MATNSRSNCSRVMRRTGKCGVGAMVHVGGRQVEKLRDQVSRRRGAGRMLALSSFVGAFREGR